MSLVQNEISVSTHGRGFVDLTAEVAARVKASGIANGICVLFVQHTSASLLIQENTDPAVRRDLEKWLAELAPQARPWEHADEGPDDMPAHASAAILPTSLTVPVQAGVLALGRWQAIYLLEHRAAPNTRKISVTIMGWATSDEPRRGIVSD